MYHERRKKELTDQAEEEIKNILNKDFNGKIEGLSANCKVDVERTLLGCKLFKRLIEFAEDDKKIKQNENELSLDQANKFKEDLRKAKKGEIKWGAFLKKF